MFHFVPVSEINIGFWKLSTHGLIIAVGFVAAVILAARAARRHGLNPDPLETAAVVGALAGLIGARLVYLLFWGEGMTFGQMLEVWNGGLSSHGGYLFGIGAAIIYLLVKKVDLLAYLDIAAPYFLFGWGIGRIGCFLNWDSYGKISNSFLSVIVYGEGRLPTQLFESAGYLLSFALTVIAARYFTSIKKGSLAALAFALFASVRFIVDFWRDDPAGYFVFSQLATGTMVVFAALYFILNQKKRVVV